MGCPATGRCRLKSLSVRLPVVKAALGARLFIHGAVDAGLGALLGRLDPQLHDVVPEEGGPWEHAVTQVATQLRCHDAGVHRVHGHVPDVVSCGADQAR